jgi:alpha-L-fucosidase
MTAVQPSTEPTPVRLDEHFDNRGVAGRRDAGAGASVAETEATGADFDGAGHALPAEELPDRTAEGLWEIGGVPYLPARPGGRFDNIVAQGQTIALPAGRYHSALLLAAGTVARPIGTGSSAAVSGRFTVQYADGATSSVTLTAPGYLGPGGVLEAGFRYRADGTAEPDATVSLWQLEVPLDAHREPVALLLPGTAAAADDEVVAGESGRAADDPTAARLHVFALSLQPCTPGGAALSVRGARCAPSMSGLSRQTIEATVVNVGTEWITEADGLTVDAAVPGGATDAPVTIRVLAPGEQVRVRIGLRADPGVEPGTCAEATISLRLRASAAGDTAATVGATADTAAPAVATADIAATMDTASIIAAVAKFPLTLGVPDYAPTATSLRSHRAPHWFTGAKFGIFIHWGVYSVPAWAPVGEDYAEWYWARMNREELPTHRHHAEVWGEDFAYDDFIPMFTAESYDPRAWVELFAAAGARYFVLTAKHHDGFCLWDTQTSERSSAHLGPKRDLVRELVDAATEHAPSLYQGLYFSRPEFFNPDGPWLGHAPRNPYTGKPEPYTGYTAGKDFARDIESGQTRELIEQFDPDLIWYDISGVPGETVHVVPEYYNRAKNRTEPKDVAVNSRGGSYAYDYRTPEYATFAGAVDAAWEASRGLDPRSYGYNAATPEDAYLSAADAVRLLVDIVSKNGNYLLDIGPRADGRIPELMRERLLEIGAWLRVNGEAIYDSVPWWRAAELGDLRFTVKPGDAFYIHSLTPPAERLVVAAQVPIREGDEVTLCGHGGGPLSWSRGADGELVVEVPAAARDAGALVWVFKVANRERLTRSAQ